MHSLDIIVQTYFLHARTGWLTEFMYLISRVFDISIYSLAITFLIAILIYFARGNRYSFLFLCSMFFGAVVSYLLKLFFNVPRPPGAVFEAFSKSFPSYHAVIVTIFFCMLIYVFDDYLDGAWQKIFNFICVLGIVLVSFSRIYLGVHWLSDVLGGILLGILISLVSIFIFKKTNHFKLKSSVNVPQL